MEGLTKPYVPRGPDKHAHGDWEIANDRCPHPTCPHNAAATDATEVDARLRGLAYEHFDEDDNHVGRCYLEDDVVRLLAEAVEKRDAEWRAGRDALADRWQALSKTDSPSGAQVRAIEPIEAEPEEPLIAYVIGAGVVHSWDCSHAPRAGIGWRPEMAGLDDSPCAACLPGGLPT